MPKPLHRRDFLALTGASLAAAAVPTHGAPPDELTSGIEVVTLRQGRPGGEPTWFHPRACMVPGDGPPTVFMTLQTIAGSDYYGPVHWMTSRDNGERWTEPRAVPPLGRVRQPDGSEEGVCDVVPEWHASTRSVLALGHNVFYQGPRFSADQPARRPVYAVWRDGAWGPRLALGWDDPRGRHIYTNGCGQRVTLPGGDILLALSFAADKARPRAVAAARCSFDGRTLAVREVGDALEHPKGRGLLEPSLMCHGGRFLMTLRAEDGRGYVTSSRDGLRWEAKRPWAWEDGEPLAMSTTQQHWLAHSDGLYLVYTRGHASNPRVFRWRAPLFMARVDADALRLRRATERVVIPLTGDGLNAPDDVPYGGNFHTVNVSPGESWVTDGQILPKRGFRGDLVLARIKWSRPNRLVGDG
jgi:hypothetical protein